MFGEAVEIRDRLADLVDGLDPDAVSGSAARELWSVLDSSERLCAAGKTLLARRVAQTHQRGSGTRSAVEELARRGGTSTGAAKDSVETSQRLADQPPVENALRRGELSLTQAALISSAAAADPAQAERLTELAGRVSVPELRDECARVRAAADPDPEATYRRLHAQRQLRRWIDSEGFWNLHARGTPQDGAAFNAAFDAIVEQFFRAARREGRRESPDAYAFDALMHLADHAAGRCTCHPQPGAGPDKAQPTANDNGGATAGHPAGATGVTDDGSATGADVTGKEDAEPGNEDRRGGTGVHPARPTAATGEEGPKPTNSTAGALGIFAASQPPAPGPVCYVRPAPSTNPRFLALLRVDVEALRRGQVAGGELCEIAGVGPVPVSVARQVLGEAIVKLVITNGVDVLNVTHLGRGPTAAQRAALLWINPTCAVEGCNRRRIEWDHREPWATTRHTRLDELDGLCQFHHDLKSRLGWALVPGTGKRPLVPPDDPRHPNNQKGNERTGGENRSAGGGSPPSAGDRPTDRYGRPPGRDAGPANAASGVRLRRRGRRTPGAGQQPDLFAEPRPP